MHDSQARDLADDDPAQTLDAFQASQHVQMGRDKWHQLDDDSKQIWDQLSDKNKAITLGQMMQSATPSNSSNSSQRVHFRDQQSTNAHEQSVASDMNSILANMSAQEHIRLVSLHDALPSIVSTDQSGSSADSAISSDDPSPVLAMMTKQKAAPPGDAHHALSSSMGRSPSSSKSSVEFNGKKHQEINESEVMSANGKHCHQVNENVICEVSQRAFECKNRSSLVDRGSNGGIGGEDAHLIECSHHEVNIRGVNNHEMVDIPLALVGGVINANRGEVIALFCNCACMLERAKSTHSPGQMEWHKLNINEKPLRTGGLQRIKTPDGLFIPLNICQGLSHMSMHPLKDSEWDALPHIVMTSPKEWDPSVLNLELEAEENWFDHVDAVEQDPVHNTFDHHGQHHRQRKPDSIVSNHDAPLLLLQADQLCSGFDIGTLSSLSTPSRQARMHDQVTGKSTITGSRLQDSSACYSKFVPTGQLHMATLVKDFVFLIAPVIAVLSDDDPTDQAPRISTLADDDPFLGFLNISFQDPDHCSIVLLSKFLLISSPANFAVT